MLFTAPCAPWCVPVAHESPSTRSANNHTEGGQGGQARRRVRNETMTNERDTRAVIGSFMNIWSASMAFGLSMHRRVDSGSTP
jgi:hypothetical protein